MKQFSELAPIAAFLIALYFSDIYTATLVLMAATALQIALMLITKQTISNMQWFVAISVLVFGGLTVFLHDERFIKLKPTIVYSVMAIAFWASAKFFNKNLMQAALGAALDAPAQIWQKINAQWVAFFAALAVANLFLAYNVSTTVWGWSKLAFVFITLGFGAWQLYSNRQYLREQKND